MHIHRAAVAEIVEAPNLIQQLVAGVNPVGCGCQMVQKLQLLGRRVDLLAVHDQLIGIQIDHQFVKRQPLGGVVGDLRPAEHRIDSGNELFHLEGLDDVIVGAHLQALDAVKDLAFGGEHDDGNLAGLPDLGAYCPAVHHRQHDVQQDQIRHLLLEFLNGFAAICGNPDVKALLYQIHVDQLRNVAVVLHHQNIPSHGTSSCVC